MPKQRQTCTPPPEPAVCAIGDTHGHLQLALCVAARWQRVLGLRFEVVLLCGDVGTFTADAQLDSATRRHARTNPCELEFLRQWATSPQPAWLDHIFLPDDRGGLGLCAPIVMTHGNHEGFEHLDSLLPARAPRQPVAIGELPLVDTGGHIRWLPSGWTCTTPAGLTVAAVGGIDLGQRTARYHELAYVDERAVASVRNRGRVDVLLTHQGPAGVQGTHGSALLQPLLDANSSRVWFHGHSIPRPDVVSAGPSQRTRVVPLGDIAFDTVRDDPDAPGQDGWCVARLGDTIEVRRERPAFWREYRRRRWHRLPDGQLVCPDLPVGHVARS